VFKTPVLRAIEAFQRADGGRSPAFIAHALNIGLLSAVELSHVLWERVSDEQESRYEINYRLNRVA